MGYITSDATNDADTPTYQPNDSARRFRKIIAGLLPVPFPQGTTECRTEYHTRSMYCDALWEEPTHCTEKPITIDSIKAIRCKYCYPDETPNSKYSLKIAYVAADGSPCPADTVVIPSDGLV